MNVYIVTIRLGYITNERFVVVSKSVMDAIKKALAEMNKRYGNSENIEVTDATKLDGEYIGIDK